MSVRHALLALLSEGPKYGLQLRQEFEARTGEVWPLNVGPGVHDAAAAGARRARRVRRRRPRTARRRASASPPPARRSWTTWLRTPPDTSAPAARRAGDQGAGRAPGARRRRARAGAGAPPPPGRDDAAATRASRRTPASTTWGCCWWPTPSCSGSMRSSAGSTRPRPASTRLPAADGRPSRPPGRRPRRQGGGTAMTAVARAAAGVEVLRRGADAGARRCDDVDLTVAGGRAGGGHGPERFGQEHAADDRRHARGGDERRRCSSSGVDVASMSRNDRARLRRRSIGYVFQDFNLLAGLTAAENVALPLELDGIGRRAARDAAAAPRSRSSAWPIGPAASPTSCPAASASGWRSPGPSSATAACCWPTSRPARSTRSTARASCGSCATACKRGVAGVVVTHDAQLASWADRVVFLRDGRMVDQTAPPAGPESLLAPAAGRERRARQRAGHHGRRPWPASPPAGRSCGGRGGCSAASGASRCSCWRCSRWRSPRRSGSPPRGVQPRPGAGQRRVRHGQPLLRASTTPDRRRRCSADAGRAEELVRRRST